MSESAERRKPRAESSVLLALLCDALRSILLFTPVSWPLEFQEPCPETAMPGDRPASFCVSVLGGKKPFSDAAG